VVWAIIAIRDCRGLMGARSCVRIDVDIDTGGIRCSRAWIALVVFGSAACVGAGCLFGEDWGTLSWSLTAGGDRRRVGDRFSFGFGRNFGR